MNPAVTTAVLNRFDFHFQKRYGQNFLIDSHVLDKIISAADITKEDFVLEIGPGIGTMTQFLSEAALKVMAVEIDKNLIPVLDHTLEAYENVQVVNEDILKMDLKEVSKNEADGKKIKVVANLPYYITTPIIMELLESKVPVSSITVMIQKEVADRMQAKPKTKDYGALSLAVQYYSKPKVVACVPPNCFIPRPGVSSEVITLEVYDEPVIKVKDEKLMFRIIRAAFNQRRKTLVNALSNSSELNVSKDHVKAALVKLSMDERVRGEALSPEEFALLSDAISEMNL
ncbi:MAG: 16S rRNA (adenine(1518)-N(6)/adenine(1519)-N(6))-dimethyltransferase RsmA [Lachnospiraceae bacterium]|nr:16S rRNA (adenine(1518)-N(6)/adenine(1519)-N(6))-dimethyltransferase RsmA [Lachnospiraceae bacterium]